MVRKKKKLVKTKKRMQRIIKHNKKITSLRNKQKKQVKSRKPVKKTKRLSKTQIARKKLKKLLKTPNFFVLASHPVMYKRPPQFVRKKLENKHKKLLSKK